MLRTSKIWYVKTSSGSFIFCPKCIIFIVSELIHAVPPLLPQQARCKTGCKTWWIEPFKGFPAVSSTGNSAKHFQNTVLVWGKSGTWWETISVTFQFWKTYEHIKLPGNIFYWWNLRAVAVLESEQFVDTFVISVHKPSWSWQNKIQIITWKLKNSTACLFKSLISKISCLVSWVCNSQNFSKLKHYGILCL